MNVLITGVSSGLGHGLAAEYLARGYQVYGLARREPQDLVSAGMRFTCVDLSNSSSGIPAIERLLENVTKFELVILNAGHLGEIKDMAAASMDELRYTMEVNMWSNKWLLDLLFSEVLTIKQVVAISSGASQSGSRGWNGYSLSKAALNMLIKLYAGERENTHFTSLAPGLIDSAMQDYLTNLPADDRYRPLEILKAAKGTEKMPDGRTCAKMLADAFPKLLRLSSGSYADIRTLE